MKRLILFLTPLFIAVLKTEGQQKDTSLKQLSSLEKPSDAAGIFKIYPGYGIPPSPIDRPMTNVLYKCPTAG